MIDYKEKYQKIINKLIGKNFPELEGKKIHIFENKKVHATAAVTKFPFFLKLTVNYRVRKYSKKLLMGIFAHELCHFEQWERHPWDYYFLQGFRVTFKKLNIKMEKETDKRAIKKGYARELYSQRLSRYRSKSISFDKLKDLYLSPREIKAYAKEIGKW